MSFLCFTIPAFSDSDKIKFREIFNSPSYHVEYIDIRETNPSDSLIQHTKSLAKQNLSIQIKSKVISNQDLMISSVGDASTNKFQQSIKVQSHLVLKNVKFLVFKQSKKYRVAAFVSVKSLNESDEDIANIAREHLHIAEKQEQLKGLNAAVEYYVKALEAVKFSSSNVSFTSTLNNVSRADLGPYCSKKVDEFLKNLNFKTERIVQDPEFPDSYRMPYFVTYLGEPVSNVVIKYGNKISNIRNGEGEILINSLSSTTFKKSTINYSLNSILGDSSLYLNTWYSIDLNFDYSGIQKLDFRVEKVQSKIWKFFPEIDHIQVNNLEWNFGDGSSSKEMNPLKQFEGNQDYKISLVVNDKIKVIRTLSNKLIHSSLLNLKSKGDNNKTQKFNRQQVAQKKYQMPTNFIDQLTKIDDFKLFWKEIQLLKSQGRVRYTKRKMKNSNNFYQVIFNTKKEILAIYEPGSDYSKKDLRSGKSYSEVNIGLKNQRKYALWFEILD